MYLKVLKLKYIMVFHPFLIIKKIILLPPGELLWPYWASDWTFYFQFSAVEGEIGSKLFQVLQIIWKNLDEDEEVCRAGVSVQFLKSYANGFKAIFAH